MTTSHSRGGDVPSQPFACQVKNLSVAYRSDPVLTHVDLTVTGGTIMGIVGPNGAGKSTLLKAMLNLVKPLGGSVLFFDEPLNAVRTRVSYMPQVSAVDWDFPATVGDVVRMGTYAHLGWIKRPGKREHERVAQALSDTGTSDLADRPIGQLSGGQRQRAFLARALAQQADLFLMDEPFQGIDATSQHAIIKVLTNLRAQGKTIIMVHHDLATVGALADHVTVLNKSVIASGAAAQVMTADNVGAAYGISPEILTIPRFDS